MALAASFVPTFKKIEEPRAIFSRFAARLGRPGAIFARPEATGVDFGTRNALIFELLRPSRVFEANFVRPLRNTAWAHEFQASDLRVTMQQRHKNVLRGRLTMLGVPNALG